MQGKANVHRPGFLLVPVILAAGLAQADEASCPYTKASLQGHYAFVTRIGGDYASGVGSEKIDGKGNLTRTSILNWPTSQNSSGGARTTQVVNSTATYIVNCDGSGVIQRTTTPVGGTPYTSIDDFMITQTAVINGRLVATAFAVAARDPSGTVLPAFTYFVTQVHTRLGDTEFHADRSQQNR